VAEEVISNLRELGFVPIYIIPGFKDPASWRFYDCDILFAREG